MIKSILKVTVLFVCMNAFDVSAFSEQQVSFKPPGTSAVPDVTFSFIGIKLDKPLDLLRRDLVKDDQLRMFHEFFFKLYEKNRNGAKSDVLSLWNPSERTNVSHGMDDASLNTNKARFDALTEMQLRMIVKFGDYYICYVANKFSDEKFHVMKFPLTTIDGSLYLTNGLNGNYFYDNISHYLDKTNFLSD